MVTRYRSLLSKIEQQRESSFRLDSDRRNFVIAHGVVRSALSQAVPTIRPEEWKFTANRYGRPEVDCPEEARCLRFNISHTQGMIACVLTVEVDCGVDVEVINPLRDLESVCRLVLTPVELDQISDMPNDERIRCFFRIWTLKEAYVKAKGIGLSIPFNCFSFDRKQDQIQLQISSTFDNKEKWLFEQLEPSPRHTLAVAVNTSRSSFRGLVTHLSLPGE